MRFRITVLKKLFIAALILAVGFFGYHYFSDSSDDVTPTKVEVVKSQIPNQQPVAQPIQNTPQTEYRANKETGKIEVVNPVPVADVRKELAALKQKKAQIPAFKKKLEATLKNLPTEEKNIDESIAKLENMLKPFN